MSKEIGAALDLAARLDTDDLLALLALAPTGRRSGAATRVLHALVQAELGRRDQR